MVIAFCNIYFGLVANCDGFFFIYVVCHISIFFKITNCDLKRIVTYYCIQRQCFYTLSHNCTTPFFEKNVKSIVLLRRLYF